MSSLRLEVIREPQALTPFLPFWRAQATTPLQSPEWMLAWWSAFSSPNTQLSVMAITTDAGAIVGLAPFYLRDDWTDGRSLRFLGSGRACGDFQTLLAASGYETQVGATVGHWLLASQNQLNWGLIELEGITRSDAAVAALVETLKQARCLLHTTELEHTWRLDLSQGWQGFMDGLSKTQRRQTRNWVNRFDKSEHWSVLFVDDCETLPAALATCIKLHQKRWMSVGEPGCFSESRFTKFIEQACHQLSTERRVSIALFVDDGQAIACQLYVCDPAGNKYMYQSGRDPERDADGVGRILNAIAVRQACQDGVGFIDFLRGDEMYKGRLGAVPAECLRLRLVAPALLPRVRHSLRTLGSSVRQQVNTLRASWKRTPAGENLLPSSDIQVEA
ncbi:MAG: GNAT family N-acetyltransferase [Aureliella sp.]